jgi:hypothetical protein
MSIRLEIEDDRRRLGEVREVSDIDREHFQEQYACSFPVREEPMPQSHYDEADAAAAEHYVGLMVTNGFGELAAEGWRYSILGGRPIKSHLELRLRDDWRLVVWQHGPRWFPRVCWDGTDGAPLTWEIEGSHETVEGAIAAAKAALPAAKSEKEAKLRAITQTR